MKYVLYILSAIVLYFAIGLDMELFESFSVISLLCLILLVYLIHLVKKLIDKPTDNSAKKDKTVSYEEKPIPPELLSRADLNIGNNEIKNDTGEKQE